MERRTGIPKWLREKEKLTTDQQSWVTAYSSMITSTNPTDRLAEAKAILKRLETPIRPHHAEEYFKQKKVRDKIIAIKYLIKQWDI